MLFSTYKYYFLHTIKWVIFLLSILVTLLKTLMLFKTSYSNNVFKEPLSKEDEAKYIDLLFKKDKHARDILIEHNLRLVAHICKKYENTNVDNDDLISIGTIGLIKGIDSYSKEKLELIRRRIYYKQFDRNDRVGFAKETIKNMDIFTANVIYRALWKGCIIR